jgi:hypothetical protein
MKLAIMQPYFLPYIGYFQLINATDKFIIFDDVNYIKKGWINRNRILLNGKEYLFTIPLENASQNKLINEIDHSPGSAWKVKLLKTFHSSYNKAPMFTEVYPMLEKIIDFENSHLSTFISNSIVQICNYLKIKTHIVLSSSQYDTTRLKGQEKILEICRKEHAGVYINPVGGFAIYQREAFNKEKVKLSFLNSKPIIYKQFGSDFIPFLSIIDVMMFNNKEKILGFLSEYELI